MKRTANTRVSLRTALYIQMIAGMVLAFIGNEMVAHNAGISGVILMVTAVTCSLCAVLTLAKTGSTARLRQYTRTRTITGELAKF